jgi:hypothetical protein
MGCFDARCAFSGVPIKDGDKMMVFPITPAYSHRKYFPHTSGYYVYDRFCLATIPFEAYYNDYGGFYINKGEDPLSSESYYTNNGFDPTQIGWRIFKNILNWNKDTETFHSFAECFHRDLYDKPATKGLKGWPGITGVSPVSMIFCNVDIYKFFISRHKTVAEEQFTSALNEYITNYNSEDIEVKLDGGGKYSPKQFNKRSLLDNLIQKNLLDAEAWQVIADDMRKLDKPDDIKAKWGETCIEIWALYFSLSLYGLALFPQPFGGEQHSDGESELEWIQAQLKIATKVKKKIEARYR